MKTSYRFIISTGILLLLILQSEYIVGQSYNPNAAATYADYWTNPASDVTRHNPAYHYYIDNDCSNFVSQCLIAGGLNLNSGPGLDQYGDGCIPECHNLHTNLINYQNATYIRKTSGYPTWFVKGDIVTLGTSNDSWSHSMFAATSNIPPLLDAHTNNRYHTSLSSYPPSGYVSCDFYHIIGSGT